MAVLYGLEFQHQSSASGKPHILSFLSARSVADDGVFEVWNAATSSGRIFRMTWEGQLQVEDGTAAKPSYGFKSDKDSGRYMSAAGTFLDVIAGTAVGTWTAGKLALAGDLEVGDDVTLKSDAAVLNFGADSDVSLTHVADTGLLLNSTMALQFNDASQYINAPSATVLDINATDEIELNATLVDVNANLEVSGTAAMTGVVTFTATPIFSSDLTIEDDLYLDSDAAVIHLGEDGDVTLTHVADTGILLNSTMQLQFNDSSQYINAPSATVLDINATDEIELNATAVDLNGTLDVSGTSTLGGVLRVNNRTDLYYNDASTLSAQIGSGGDIGLNTSSANADFNIKCAGEFAVSIDGSSTTMFNLDGTTTTIIGDALISDDLTLNSDAAVLGFGADTDVTLTHVADTGLLLNSTRQLQFNDASQYIAGISATVLSIAATDEIDLTATAIDINGTANISGATVLATSLNIASDGATVTGIKDEDNMASNSATKLATQQSIVAYVAAQITAEDLDVTSDSGTIDIDLNSETLTIAGGTGLASSASSTTVTLAIDSTVATLTGSQTLTNKVLTSPDINAGTVDGITSLTVGTDGSGADVYFYSATSGDHLFWDASEELLTITGTNGQTALNVADGNVTVADTLTATNIGAFTASGAIDFDSENMTNVDVNSGTIDGTVIGGASVAAGSFAALVGTTITGSGVLSIDDTTDSTSTTSGSIHTDGGVGVAKDLIVGNDITLISDASVLNFGVNSDVSLTHVHDTGLLLNGAMALQFNDASQYINAPSATVLDINATDEIELNATAVDLNGTLDVSGNVTMESGVLSMGTTPSATGSLRMPAAWSLQSRRTSSGDGARVCIGVNAITGTEVLDIGDNTSGRWDSIRFHAGAANTLKLEPALITADVAVTMGLSLTVATDVIIGTNPASAGDIRLNKNFGIFTRNNANDANKVIVSENTFTGNDTLDFGDNGQWSALRFHCSALNVMELTSSAINLNKVVTAGGMVYINDSANAKMTLGLTINQGAADDEIIAFKSSDVNQPSTNYAEADTYGYVKKSGAAYGGVSIGAFTESGTDGQTFLVYAVNADAANTTKSTSGEGLMQFDAAINSGTGSATVGTDGNMVAFTNNGNARFLFDAEGSGHADVEWTTFSDSRLKTNVEASPYGLTQVRGVEAKIFDKWSGKIVDGAVELEEDTNRRMVGFLAQEIKAEMPELVKDLANDDSFYSMDYGRITPILWSAVKELDVTVQSLEARIAALEAN